MNNVVIILAGGSGNRLWPLSTTDHPKSFLDVFNRKSMLEASLFRAKLFADIVYVVTSNDMVESKEQAFHDLGVERENIIIEPTGADTAAAIAFSVAQVKRKYGSDVAITLFPVDHQIRNQGAFYRDIGFALKAAKAYDSVTLFGITPSFAATGYGYIKLGGEKKREGRTALFSVESFLEKPNQSVAARFLKDPDYVWNSGMYVGTVEAFERTFKKNTALYDWYSAIVRGLDEPMPELFQDFHFDHRLIEGNTAELQVVMATFDWKDIGTYDELYRSALETDEHGNAIKAEAVLRDCSNCLVIGSDRKIVALGLDDIAIVDGRDGILVCQKSVYSQLVGEVATGKEQPAHE